MGEFQTFFSQQQDRINYIWGIKPSSEELSRYQSILEDRGVLVQEDFPLFTSPGGGLSKFEQAFRKNYQVLFGQDTLDKFFSSFTTDNIFIIKSSAYETVVNDWIGFYGAEGSRAVYHPDAHVIFIKEPPTNISIPKQTYIQARLLEEVLHEFLDSEVAGGKLHNMLKRFHLSRERRNALQVDFYEDIPEEKMVKAMKLTIAEDMFAYSLEDLFPFTDFLSADEGEKLLQSLGRKRILQGNWSRKFAI